LKSQLGLPRLAANDERIIYRTSGLTFLKVLGKIKFRPFETEASAVRDGLVFSNMAFIPRLGQESNREIDHHDR